MCIICYKLKDKRDVLLDNDKWCIYKSGLVIWKVHEAKICGNCQLWIQLKCRQFFGKKCKYDYKFSNHFNFRVEAENENTIN